MKLNYWCQHINEGWSNKTDYFYVLHFERKGETVKHVAVGLDWIYCPICSCAKPENLINSPASSTHEANSK